MALRKGQRELVEQYRGGYCAVPAIPGGGKTHCLSLWAVEMISQGLHHPGKILIVTYMNSAVNNFKQRISTELQKRGINGSRDYVVSTIHSLCLQIVKERPDLISASEEFDIIEDASKYLMIGSALEEWRQRHENLFKLYMDEACLNSGRAVETCNQWQDRLCEIMLTAIGDFKSRGIGPAEAVNRCRQLPEHAILRWAADIYEIYDRKLKMSGLLDFDDMLYSAKCMLVEDAELLQKYQKKFTYVCEDEAQDSNLIQSEILTMIAKGNLLRVGDSNQAICGSFTSSDFTLFKEFCDLPQTTVYKITQSSRNTRDIIDLANYFVTYIRENHPVPECRDSLLAQYIESVDAQDERQNPVTPEYGIKAAVFKSWEEEVGGIVRQAYHMLNKYPDKSIAILVPSARKISDVVDLLESRNMPYEQLDNSSKERNKPLRKLGRMVDFLAAPADREKFGNMVDECLLSGKEGDPLGSHKKKEQKKLLLGFLHELSVEDLLYPKGEAFDEGEVPDGLRHSEVWSHFLQMLDLLRELLEFPSTQIEKLILMISDRLCFDREERAIAQKVASDCRFLKNRNPCWGLGDLASELLSSKSAFSFYAGIVWELKGYEPKPGTIMVATYHKSKGLEWDIVFLSSLSFADFPVGLKDRFIGEYWFLKQEYRNPRAIVKAQMKEMIEGKGCGDSILESKLETLSEKARLLYVGITRAREYLFLSAFHANAGKKNESQPSRYLLELQKYIMEHEMNEKHPQHADHSI